MFQVVWLNVSCISKLDPEASGGGLETVVFLFRIQKGQNPTETCGLFT